MENEKFIEIMNEIKTKVSDETGEIGTLLTDLYDGFNGVSNKVKELTDTNTKLTTNNETLKEQNLKLFLKVGNEVHTESGSKTSGESTLKYENLFNEKGELK